MTKTNKKNNNFEINLIPFSGLGKVVASVVVVVLKLAVVSVILIHMYVAGSVVQCPSLVQVAVMVSLGNKPSSQVKVMDDPSNVVV